MESIYNRNYIITASDGSQWSIPIKVIADNRAKYYASMERISSKQALEDTIEEFEASYWNDGADFIEGWARDNMDWCDVQSVAVKIRDANSLDMEKEWTNPEFAEIE